MRYADTSVLLAYLTPEIHSRVAENFMLGTGDVVAISSWTEVELLSGLGLKLRTAQLNDVEVLDALDSYTRLVSPQLHRIAVEDAHHRAARMLISGWRTTLRAGDALHLAIAAAHGMTIYTLDRGMVAAAATLEIPATLL